MNMKGKFDRNAEERAFDDSLRRALTEEPLDVSPLMAHVRREMGPAAAQPSRAFTNMRMGAVAAAMLVVIVATVWINGAITGARRRSAIAADVACDHHEELVGVKVKRWPWKSAPADVRAYMNEHFPHSGNLIGALTPPGASFEKVATCRPHGLRFTHFVYRTGAGEISVFVRLTEPARDPMRHFDYHDERFGLQVAGFNTPQYEGMVVSTLPTGPTRDIADQLSRRL